MNTCPFDALISTRHQISLLRRFFPSFCEKKSLEILHSVVGGGGGRGGGYRQDWVRFVNFIIL